MPASPTPDCVARSAACSRKSSTLTGRPCTVDETLVNALEQEKAQGKAGRLAASLVNMDLAILDELGYLPFSQAGGALLDRLTHHCHIIETGNDSCRFRHSSRHAKAQGSAREHARKAVLPVLDHEEVNDPV